MEELVQGMKDSLDERVFVGLSRGVWDCVGRAVSDGLCSLEDSEVAKVLPRRLMRQRLQYVVLWNGPMLDAVCFCIRLPLGLAMSEAARATHTSEAASILRT